MNCTSTEYFDTTTPPINLNEISEKVDLFIKWHATRNSRVVLVTKSGGTTVPLESQTVRFLDNFSAGTRGSASAEYYLEHGYAVIFLHRQFSLQPFSRHFSHSTNCFLDYMTISGNKLEVNTKWADSIKPKLLKYQHSKENNTLLVIDFITVRDYLFTLRSISQLMATLGKNAIYYLGNLVRHRVYILAAAVSDFFIPECKMIEHKIQSDENGLSLSLDKVPKIIQPIVKEWSPLAFVVSFKLETDSSLLIPKSRASLMRYGHQIVVGNVLSTRKKRVLFVTLDSQQELDLDDESIEIETLIVKQLIEQHTRWINI